MSRILVTGGAGFIGSHVVDTLLAERHEVTILDSLEANVGGPRGLAPDKATLVALDLVSLPPGWARDFDAIVHAAAYPDIASNWAHARERQRLYRCNIQGTIALLEAAEGVPVVFFSTSAVYGTPRILRPALDATEDPQEGRYTPCISPYAASKLAGEALVQAYAHRYDAPWYCLRPGIVLGPRYHHGHVADFVRMASVDGRIEPKNDGTLCRKVVDARDVADVVKGCLARTYPEGVYDVAAWPWTPRDTIKAMGAGDITTWPESRGAGWVGDPEGLPDSSKLRGFGWIPRFGPIESIRATLAALGWRP